MGKLWYGLAILGFCLGGCSDKNPVDNAEKNDTKIIGTVIQSGANAKVYLTQGRILDSATADTSDGFFEFDGVQAGTYELRVVAAAYDTFFVRTYITDGQAIYVGAVYLASLNPTGATSSMDTIPSVYDHYPKDKAEVLFNPYTYYSSANPPRLYISVSFDRPMDRKSVEQALSINPPVSGYFEWSQNKQTYNVPTYNWSGSSLYSYASSAVSSYDALISAPYAPSLITTFTKVQSFTFYFNLSGSFTDTTYTIKLSREAMDTGGVPLDSALEFSFSTVQSATSSNDVEMLPHNGEDFVDLFSSAGIQITFPRRMDQASTEAHIAVTPSNNVFYVWQDYNKLTVYTGGIFIPDTTYRVSIDSEALDQDGKSLGKRYDFSFSTRSIGLKSSIPTNGQLMVSSWDKITLNFNTYMDKTDFPVMSRLVSAAGDTVSGNWDYYHYTTSYGTIWQKQTLEFDPAANLANNQKYTLTIDAGVKDIMGFPARTGFRVVFVTMP